LVYTRIVCSSSCVRVSNCPRTSTVVRALTDPILVKPKVKPSEESMQEMQAGQMMDLTSWLSVQVHPTWEDSTGVSKARSLERLEEGAIFSFKKGPSPTL
jgi:hypothetical protein